MSGENHIGKIHVSNLDGWWQAVLDRNEKFDGTFVYAVESTGVYCRPSCPSRRPQRDKVRFFLLPEAAEQSGYRPCLRCKPNQTEIFDPHAKMVRQACRLIEEQDSEVPLTLKELASRMDISSFHFQKIFKRIMGITPRQYSEACRLHRLKSLVKEGKDITCALYEAGYSSSSRLYEKATARLGMTPGTYLRGGKGVDIRYTIADCTLGRLMIAATRKGICFVSLGDSDAALKAGLFAEYPEADIRKDDNTLKEWVEALLAHLAGWQPYCDLPMDVRFTAFQWRVYDALRAIPYGETRTYEEIATQLKQPKAARAVGRACAGNPIALVIPCHRVVRKDGALGGYRWGLERKRKLLEQEKTHTTACINNQDRRDISSRKKEGK